MTMGWLRLFRLAYTLGLAIAVVGYPNDLPEPDFAFDFESDTGSLITGTINGAPATGAISSSVDVVSGVVGMAIELNEGDTNDYIHFGDRSSNCFSTPSLCTDGLTLGFWIQFKDLSTPGTNDFGYIYSSAGHVADGITIRYKLFTDGTKELRAWFNDGDTQWELNIDAAIFVVNVWYHFTYVYNINTGPKVYINGTEAAATLTDTSVSLTATHDLYIGAAPTVVSGTLWRPEVILDHMRAWHDVVDPFEVFLDGRISDHCHFDSECPNDKICYFWECIDSQGLVCLVDEHCADGAHCHDRTCIPNGDHCHIDAHCSVDQHCHDPICFDNIHHCEGDYMCPDGMHCINRMCFDKGGPCDSDDDCLDDYHCIKPRCLKDSDYCYDDNDCGHGFHCHDTYCFNDTKHCHKDEHCGANSHCLEPLCFLNSERCFSDVDCLEGYHCHESVCVYNRFHCEKKEHCDADEHCYKTMCIKDSLQCMEDKHCDEGYHCHNAVCYLNEDHCHDHFVCGKGYHCHGGICYENALHCHSNTDCGPGNHCHAEICYKNSSHCHSNDDCPDKICFKTQCIEIPVKGDPDEYDMDLIIIVAPVTGVVTFFSILIVICILCHYHTPYPPPQHCPEYPMPQCQPPYPPPQHLPPYPKPPVPPPPQHLPPYPKPPVPPPPQHLPPYPKPPGPPPYPPPSMEPRRSFPPMRRAPFMARGLSRSRRGGPMF